jgi:hypothetical protein
LPFNRTVTSIEHNENIPSILAEGVFACFLMQFKLFKNLMKLVDKEGWNFVKHFFFTHLRKMTFVERLITQLQVVSKQENPQQFQE